jgi:hypothetical protein
MRCSCRQKSTSNCKPKQVTELDASLVWTGMKHSRIKNFNHQIESICFIQTLMQHEYTFVIFPKKSTPALPQGTKVPRVYDKMTQIVYIAHIHTSTSDGQPTRVFSTDGKMQCMYTCCNIKNTHLNHVHV